MTKKAKGDATTLVAVRLTAAQRRRMEAAAAREGLGLSTWMRRLALHALDEKPTAAD